MSRFIKSFQVFSSRLFRFQNGHDVHLREYTGLHSVYDLRTVDGYVEAKAQRPLAYVPPNGASMRPNGQRLIDLLRLKRGPNWVVYTMESGTKLPNDLVLVHEFKEHYSLQPSVDMHISDLNEKLTIFFELHGSPQSKDTWLDAHNSTSRSSAQSCRR